MLNLTEIVGSASIGTLVLQILFLIPSENKQTARASKLKAVKYATVCPSSFEVWPQTWRAQVLKEAPMIAPARQFTYPHQIAGEEDALGRGALHLLVHPAAGGTFLAICALGFTSASVPTGLFACPNADELCAVAGGYVYLIDTRSPSSCTHLALKPVADVRIAAEAGLLLFAGFHKIMAWGSKGLAWETSRLSWEGLQLGEINGLTLHGTGWNMPTDKEIAFTVDLQTGEHTGGGY